MKQKFSAFHGKQEIKDRYIARMKAHMTADELVQGTGFRNGKGCAIGCTLDKYSHIGYEEELGIPFTIAIIEDNIFESLSKEKSKNFPLEFLESVNVGSDLSKVYNKIEIFHLEFLKQKLKEPELKICNELIYLHEKVISGLETIEEEWINIKQHTYHTHRAHLAYLAHLADRAHLAHRAYHANRADLAHRAYRAYHADLADLAHLADIADITREKFIQLIKEEK